MTLEELASRLPVFCRAMYGDDGLQVSKVRTMPGHAGFSFGFAVTSRGLTDKWFLRLPPPDVKHVGTADVLRQVAVLNVLPDSVPHCRVHWSGDDEQWFGSPYFVVPQLEGDVVRTETDGWVSRLNAAKRQDMAGQAVNALAELHKLDWREVPYLGDPVGCAADVLRWDRFVEKSADPHRLQLAPTVKSLLLKHLPQEAPIGIYHGDFQWSNLFYSDTGNLLAVIDWELVGVGAVLNDLGWIATFNDPAAWAHNHHTAALMPEADEMIDMYNKACGRSSPDLSWYRSLAAYKFAIISGFNLMLHRRGKRHDPLWEITAESIEPLLVRAQQLLQ